MTAHTAITQVVHEVAQHFKPAPVAPPPTPPGPAALPSGFNSPDLSVVPGVPQSFAACVAFRESTDGAGSTNIYGIIPASGVDVEGASLAQQKQAFAQLYAEYGTQPWAPNDGC